ncbi:MAG TPA: 3-oxoacyl-ACP synthase III [Planctomycetota bacterium]|nr:3-oxoacyl-ACP synthase III [Planctomycetota bacterium]
MQFRSVRLASIAHHLPERTVPSLELEERLGPLYRRLGLHAGRLELMTGIRERRFFEPGTLPSAVAAAAGERALAASGVARERIGCLIHAAVCRDALEPSTASFVHQRLELPERCLAFDLSNACLGFANALAIAGGMIERGDLDAVLIVAGEEGRPLVEATIAALLADPRAGKAELKSAFASLTIGSGAAAAVLARTQDGEPGARLLGSVALADTSRSHLCRGEHQASLGAPLMRTDSEALLNAGCALAARTWRAFLAELSWTPADVERVITHQVGAAHRRMLLTTLEIDPERDFPTYEHFGNVGSVSLPLSHALAVEAGFLHPGQRVAWLGIGSGLHCQMLALHL